MQFQLPDKELGSFFSCEDQCTVPVSACDVKVTLTLPPLDVGGVTFATPGTQCFEFFFVGVKPRNFFPYNSFAIFPIQSFAYFILLKIIISKDFYSSFIYRVCTHRLLPPAVIILQRIMRVTLKHRIISEIPRKLIISFCRIFAGY